MTLKPPLIESAEPYADRLSWLLGILTAELHKLPRDSWACRTHQGRKIGLTVGEDGRRVLRISSYDRPKGASEFDRWRGEVATMLQHLGCAHWQGLDTPDLSTAAWFVEPALAKGSGT